MAQCVMTSGMTWRPEWSADNWDTSRMVHANVITCTITIIIRVFFYGSLFPELYNEFGVLNSVLSSSN